MIKPPATPSVAIARVLRGLGLEQGKAKDFRIIGEYRNGERLSTSVLALTRHAEETIANAADRIEQLTDCGPFPFAVSVHYTPAGRPMTHVTNGAVRRVRETPPATARPTEAEVEQIAAAEAPAVVAMLRTRRQERAYVTYVCGEEPAAGADLEPDQVCEDSLAEALAAEVRTELTAAETVRFRPDMTGVDPYTAPAHLAGPVRVIAGDGFASLEFSDRSRRGPERRELAASLGRFFGVTPVRRPRWRTVTVEEGYETDQYGRLRATSRTEERVEMLLGWDRTDMELTGDPEQLARFAALLPTALVELDKLSAAWSHRYARHLATRSEAEYLMMSSEHRGAVRRWRRTFAQHIADATGAGRSTGAGALAEGEFLHRREAEAATEALCELGWLWLEDLATAAGRDVNLAAAVYGHTIEDTAIAKRLATWAQHRTAEIEQQLAEAQQTEGLAPVAVEPVVEELLDQGAGCGQQHPVQRRARTPLTRRPTRARIGRPASRRPKAAPAYSGSIRPPAPAAGRGGRTPVRGTGGALRNVAKARAVN